MSGEHVYEYAGLNPVSRVDPLGLFSFLAHYWKGKGAPVDLANVGLLDEFVSSRQIKGVESRFGMRAEDEGRKKAKELCGSPCPAGLVAGTYPVSKGYNADFKTSPSQLWVLGNVRIVGTAMCGLVADCQKRVFNFSCDAGFRLVDEWFSDPLDVFNLVEGSFELRGAQPYPILAGWGKVITGTGKF